VDRFLETDRMHNVEFNPTDLILRSAEGASRRMATHAAACCRPSRRAQKRAPQDEVDDTRYDPNFGNGVLVAEKHH
jgi:hypothetical protein